MPSRCAAAMEVSSVSQPVVSTKFTESASTSTCFAGGWLAASAARSPLVRWPTLAKNRSPPGRQMSSPDRAGHADRRSAISLVP